MAPDTDPPAPEARKDVTVGLVIGGIFACAVAVLTAWVAWRPHSAPAEPPPPKVEQIDPPPELAARKPGTKQFVAQRPLIVTHDEGPAEPRQVEKSPTPMTELAIAQVLIQAHEVVFGSEPNDQRLSVAWAQIALEHRRGRDVYCNNLGNITVPENVGGDFYADKVMERTRKDALSRPSKWEKVDMRYRAFSTPLDGAVAYWKLIRDRYTDALAYFDQGNGYLAARRLSEGGYMTAEGQVYSSGMGSLQQEFFVRVYPELKGGGRN